MGRSFEGGRIRSSTGEPDVVLLRMADDEGGDRITRKLTHHTIAQMIGSSRETVSRTMRNLVERGIIQVTRKEITLRDRRSLMLAARRA